MFFGIGKELPSLKIVEESPKLQLRYVAKSFPDLDASTRKHVVDFLTALDDHDDVHRVYAAIK